jgi:hypothetical protein
MKEKGVTKSSLLFMHEERQGRFNPFGQGAHMMHVPSKLAEGLQVSS